MEELYKRFRESSGVSIDTRTIKGGELFFCLKGDQFNGNKFASQALEDGASFIIVDDADYYIKNAPMLLVDDSLKVLQELSKYHRGQLNIPVIGITGTNGKTTTKELINAVLSAHFQTLSTNGNFNNHIGVPLTLLRIEDKHQIAVIEMGANHLGEIADLCKLSQPNFGLITNIGKAHLEGFGSFENIIITKTALYRSIQQSAGTVFLNADDELLIKESEGLQQVKYSVKNNSNVRLELVTSDGSLKFRWNNISVQTQLFGEYNIYNAAAAIAIGEYFKIPSAKIVKALEEYKPSNNRSQLVNGDNNELILDAYNANPDSMKQALSFFNQASSNKKAVILGDMLELGEYEKIEHKKILDLLDSMNFDEVFLVGSAFSKQKANYPPFQFFKDNMTALEYFKSNHLIGYRILLKGSRGISLELLKDQLL